jgi:hypothetical protein
MHNNDMRKNLINNINIMIPYNHIEMLPKNIWDVIH